MVISKRFSGPDRVSEANIFHSDLEAIANAIEEGRKEKNKPTIICLRTTIGYGSKLQGTHGVHGARKSITYRRQSVYSILPFAQL